MESGKRFWLVSCLMAVCLLSVGSGNPDLEEIHHMDASEVCNSVSDCRPYSSSKQGFKEGSSDVYEYLWTNNQDIAQQTLKLPFLQHIRLGDLQADDYVNFMIQDINYLLKVTFMLKEMSEKVKKPEDIRDFLKGRYESYKDFAELMLKEFNLNGVSEIKPIPAMQKYLSDYKTIMEKEDPIFFAVGLLPCERLWLWLANQVDIGYGNAYFIWKKNNMHGSPEKKYRKLLIDNLKTPEQIERANQIFRQQIQNEHDFFAASLQE